MATLGVDMVKGGCGLVRVRVRVRVRVLCVCVVRGAGSEENELFDEINHPQNLGIS
jgi:hypothetical protein